MLKPQAGSRTWDHWDLSVFQQVRLLLTAGSVLWAVKGRTRPDSYSSERIPCVLYKNSSILTVGSILVCESVRE